MAAAAAIVAAGCLLAGCGSGQKHAPKACNAPLAVSSYLDGKNGTLSVANDQELEAALQSAPWPTPALSGAADKLAARMQGDDPQGASAMSFDTTVYSDLAGLLKQCTAAAK